MGSDTNDVGRSVAFFGIPFEWDNFQTADRIDFLNSANWQVRVVGPELIYKDAEEDLGLSGQPRAKGFSICSQFQQHCVNPRRQSFVTNAD